MATSAEQVKKRSISDILVDFLSKYRTVILVGSGIFLLVLFGFAIGVTVADNQRLKAIVTIETFAERYNTVSGTADETQRSADAAALSGDILGFAAKASGYAKARAYALLGTIAADAKDWVKAEEYYLLSAEVNPKSYQTPVGLYNAAAAAEERGDNTRAVELYARCADGYGSLFPMAPRAYFAIGRLNETDKNYAAAAAAYQKIVDTWPSDNWTKLANGRILAIAALGGN